MPLSELENYSESILGKIFANKTSHYVASWYRQPGGSREEFQLYRDQLEIISGQSIRAIGTDGSMDGGTHYYRPLRLTLGGGGGIRSTLMSLI